MIFQGKTNPQGMHNHTEHVLLPSGKVIAIFKDFRLETQDEAVIEKLLELGYKEAPPDPVPQPIADTFKVAEVVKPTRVPEPKAEVKVVEEDKEKKKGKK